jgi:hypothetical protein
MALLLSGSRQEIIPQDCAGFGFVCKAHPAAHIAIGVGGCNAGDGPKDKQDVELFFLGPLYQRVSAVAGYRKGKPSKKQHRQFNGSARLPYRA